jgi:hypothetical protein
MRDRRRALDQPRIDFAEAGGLIDRGELLGRRIPVARLERRRLAADHQLLIESLA